MKQTKSDILQGTLGLLILRTLAHGEMHGWGVSQRLQQISQDVLQVTQGSLHPALYRLEQQGWIESSWGDSDNTGARSSTGSPSPGTARSPRKPRAGSGHDCRRPGPRAGVSPAADLELETDALVARGAGPAEASGVARRRCGSVALVKTSAATRGGCAPSTPWPMTRAASPGYTALVLLTLGVPDAGVSVRELADYRAQVTSLDAGENRYRSHLIGYLRRKSPE